MFAKIIWIIVIGLLAYVLEYGLGLTESPARAIVYVLAIPLLLLYALSRSRIGLTGRLKGAESLEHVDSKNSTSRDPVFVVSTILYAGIYLNVLFRLEPREWDRLLEIILVLSPVELFWLGAPIAIFWWYRQWALNRKQTLI